MFTKKNKKIIIAGFVFLFISILSTNTYAAAKIDLSQQKILSKNGDYYFKIPVSWEYYVYANRDSSDGKPYFDKIDFYYSVKDGGNNDIKFLTLYTYYTKDYVKKNDQKAVLATDEYVFTMTTVSDNPYTTTFDSIIFSRILIEIETANFVSSKITLSESKNNLVQSGTLTVNNQNVSTKPITSDGEIYLPLRETAEKLGYDVTWIASNRSIILSKGSKKVTISTTSTPNLINKNDRIYLPIKFFMQKLNISVDIDANNNIKIKG